MREIKTTEDGSTTLLDPRTGDTYHSIHGAVAESEWIYLTYGFEKAIETKKSIHILEMGFGTGLNLLLTLDHFWKLSTPISIDYHSYELYPLAKEEWEALSFANFSSELIAKIHQAPWDKEYSLAAQFMLTKHQEDFIKSIFCPASFDLVYYDAFAPSLEPTLWTEDVLLRVVRAMSRGAIFVTYSTKGAVVRALKEAGLEVEKLPGPKGKREVLRAIKP